MPGPAPKNEALRQRRNTTASSAALPADADARPKRRVPGLPKLMDVVETTDGHVQVLHEWHPLTRSWWRDVWRSPMAARYLQADVHGLYRLAVLVDAYWRNPDPKLAGEIRLEQQCFGLTPIDRLRLQWRVDDPDAANTPRRNPLSEGHLPAAPETPPAGAPADPRDVLRVLAGGKAA